MKKAVTVLQGIALLLIFGTALCADGLANVPYGFAIMFLSIGIAGLLVFISNHLGTKKPPPVSQLPGTARPA